MTPSPVAILELLVFDVGDRRLALRARDVHEVIRAVAIAPLPKAPPVVEGVINVRGTLMPVLDLRKRFGLPPVPITPEQHFILARAGPRPVALRVDRALDLTIVPEDAVESATRVVPRAEYVAGLARLADGVLVIHDLERFLSLDEEQQVDAAVVGAMAAGDPGPRRAGEPSSQRRGKR